ncbi:MAG TPA: rhomboid family intramembrane serine protease [Candidatus Methanoperedens sp.]|nr:rhomboid family intramembrane serine protease [Candidatus Methanoperedens sp.]
MTTWVLRLIVVNAGVFLFTAANPRLLGLLAFVPRLALLQPWTIITYQFAHAGLGHLLFNMLGLFFFGSRLEEHLGARHFLGLYFASGVTGALLSFLSFNSPIVGASAAIFGVFLGFAHYWPRERVYIWGLLPVEARVLVAVMTVLALFGGLGFGGAGIANFAHLGGFLGGWIYLRWMGWSSPAARFQRRAAAPAVRGGDLERWRRANREAMHPLNRAEFDRVMAKLEAGGPGSLTSEERAFLNRFAPE